MITNLERSDSLPRNRFGQLSKNMFFARHVAQPRYLKFITGAAGQRVCYVREKPIQIPVPKLDDGTKPLISDPRFSIEFPPNSYNEALLRSYADRIQPKKRRERLLPPISGWNPSGMVVQDTQNWRRELSRIAEMVGLVTPDELVDIENRKETPVTPQETPLLSVDKLPITTGQYSRQSGRWNETPTPKSASRSRSARRLRSARAAVPNNNNNLLCVDEQEREIWMLQVLCQILQTESMNDIQSWLVSSGPNEKEAVRQLITKAIKGLEENGRIQPSAHYNENAKAIQVNMDSFGSLLAAKFPHVSSLIPVTPFSETPSRPRSRPKTAPELHTKTEFNNKSTEVVESNLQTVDENIETESINTKPNTPQPITVDIQHEVQILIFNDDENKIQQITNEGNKIQQMTNEGNNIQQITNEGNKIQKITNVGYEGYDQIPF